MDFHRLFTTVYPHIRHYIVAIVLGGVGLILIVYGLMSLLASKPSNDGVVFEAAPENTKINVAKVTVDVSGSVEKPGVYTLGQGARIKDALVAAGGISQSANRVWIAKNLNLAARVKDESKIYIPSSEEPGISNSTSQNPVMGLANSQININEASSSELESLPGIGPVTAQKIISSRPYQSTSELLTKKIVGEKAFSQIEEKIRTY